MFIRLPPSTQNANSRPGSSSSPRYPLTSPTVTPPSVSTHNSCATRRDSGCGDSTKARALLSRVASSPTTPKVRPSSPAPSNPEHRSANARDESQRHPSMVGAMERRYSDGYEAARGWTGHQQRDGYISFPDFEKYFQGYEDVHGEHPQRPEIQT